MLGVFFLSGGAHEIQQAVLVSMPTQDGRLPYRDVTHKTPPGGHNGLFWKKNRVPLELVCL